MVNHTYKLILKQKHFAHEEQILATTTYYHLDHDTNYNTNIPFYTSNPISFHYPYLLSNT